MYTDQDINNLVNRVQQLEIRTASNQVAGLPNFGLLSKNLLTRAFSVWGLAFLANFLIGIGLSCIGLIVGLLLGKGILEMVQSLLSQYMP